MLSWHTASRPQSRRGDSAVRQVRPQGPARPQGPSIALTLPSSSAAACFICPPVPFFAHPSPPPLYQPVIFHCNRPHPGGCSVCPRRHAARARRPPTPPEGGRQQHCHSRHLLALCIGSREISSAVLHPAPATPAWPAPSCPATPAGSASPMCPRRPPADSVDVFPPAPAAPLPALQFFPTLKTNEPVPPLTRPQQCA